MQDYPRPAAQVMDNCPFMLSAEVLHWLAVQIMVKRVRPAPPVEDAQLNIEVLSIGGLVDRNFGSTRPEWRRGIIMGLQRPGPRA